MKVRSFGEMNYRRYGIMSKAPIVARFSEMYKRATFYKWYDAGKPHMPDLERLLEPEMVGGKVPKLGTLRVWFKSEWWKDWEAEKDAEIDRALSEKLVQGKVELFTRHAETARQMQELGLEVLLRDREKITPSVAARLLVEGMNIEQGTAGIPEMLEKMRNMTDEDLKDEISEILAKTPVDNADND